MEALFTVISRSMTLQILTPSLVDQSTNGLTRNEYVSVLNKSLRSLDGEIQVSA